MNCSKECTNIVEIDFTMITIKKNLIDYQVAAKSKGASMYGKNHNLLFLRYGILAGKTRRRNSMAVEPISTQNNFRCLPFL